MCLHCLREERLVAQARTRQRLSRLVTAAIGLAVVGALGAVGVDAIRDRRGDTGLDPDSGAGAHAARDSEATIAQTGSATAAQFDDATTTRAGETETTTQQGNRPSLAIPASPVRVAGAPTIAPGRTELADGLFALRTGDTVEVHFDTPDSRTRRRDKFEHILRVTLPLTFGAIADSALLRVREGSLVTGGDLLSELPVRGLRIAAVSGFRFAIFPVTRPGQDGPLVVVYRASIEHDSGPGLATR